MSDNQKNKPAVHKIKQSLQNMNKTCEKWRGNIRKAVDFTGKYVAKTGLNANAVSILGFIIGISAVNFLALNMYGWALLCIAFNRFFDMLDGAVARYNKVTEFGIFLDAALDYIFYAGVIFGFALAYPAQNAVAAAFLLFAFTASSCSMLAYAVIAYRRHSEKALVFDKSPFYLGGFAQGIEVFAAIAVMCLMPFWFMEIAIVVGILCLVKALSIVAAAYYNFVIAEK